MTEQNLLAVGQPEGSTTYPGCFLYGKWKWQKNKILIKNQPYKKVPIHLYVPTCR